MSKHVKVILAGCDDSTHFEFEATSQNLDVLRSLQAISWDKSDYCCQPIIVVEDDQGQQMWEEDVANEQP